MHQDETTGWTKFEYSAPDGLRLAGRQYGWRHRENSVVVCLAGLTRNSVDFHELALHLANDEQAPRAVLALDYRGRGMSDYDPDPRNYNPLTEAEDAIAGLIAAGVGHASFIATSRGGLIAMILSAMRPSVIRAVVLNDIGPRIGAKGLLRIRSYLTASQEFANWSSAIRFLRESGENQFPSFGEADWERQAHAIYEERDGRIHRRYDRNLLRAFANIRLDHTLPEMWPQFRGLLAVPVMAIRGENSDLLDGKTLQEMAQMHPDLDPVTVNGQGHAPDFATDGLAERVSAFLAKADRRH